MTSSPAADHAVKPNILLIFTDQQTHNAFSAWGNPHLHTPAMDRIAAGGTLFRKAYCTSPVCGPSRAGLVTGCMPHRTEVVHNNVAPNPWVRNVGELLEDHGYATVWAGKWHNPEPYPAREGMARIPGFSVLPFYDRAAPEREWAYGANTDEPLADAVCDYLTVPPDKPFFLAVSFHNPHDICFFVEDRARFPLPQDEHELPPLPANFAVADDEPDMLKLCRDKTRYGSETHDARNFSDRDWREYLYTFYRLTERVDRQVGRVLDALERSGKAGHTLIVFTSDHGNGNAAHRWASKLSLYDEAAAVPLIFSLPGHIRAGVQDDRQAVSLVDVLPTLCDYAGAAVPTGVVGQSLRPLLEGSATLQRDYVVTDLAPFHKDSEQAELEGRMLRTADYKYCVYAAGHQREQLFDMRNDPGENVNLARDATCEELCTRLRASLREWLRRTNDSFSF